MKSILKIRKNKFWILLISALILLLVSGIFIVNKYVFPKNQRNAMESATEISDFDNIPTLKLPLRYFPDASITWGSAGATEKPSDMTEAAIDEGSISFPTTTISIKGFDSKVRNLASIKSEKEITKICNDGSHSCGDNLNKEQISDYGNLATRFLPDEFITAVNYFDVDSDGLKEAIVYTCGTFGNHCPHKIIIIKGDKQIFSVDEGIPGLDLKKSETGNGFFVESVPERLVRSMCCPIGYIKTRFVYEKGKFKPVYEQEVRYFEVINTEAVKK